MKEVALLREVTPVRQNRIPKMVYPAEILIEAGLENVRTCTQSSNTILETTLSGDDVCTLIRDMIQVRIGVDLSVILKTQAQFATALAEGPFDESYDDPRAHSVSTNSQLNQEILDELLKTGSGAEILKAGSKCLYPYLSREVKEKRLNINYPEKQLHIIAIM